MAGRVEFTLTRDDFGEASRATYAHSLGTRRFASRMVVALVAAAVMGAALGFNDGRSGAPFLMAGGFAIWIIIVLGGVIGGTYLLLPRRAARLYNQQPSAQRPLCFEWDEVGLTLRSSGGVGQVGWPDYHRWDERRGLLLFYLNEQLYHVIPRRALTPEQADDLRQTAAAYST